MNNENFEALLNKMLDGELSAAENSQLEVFLSQSQENMQRYLDFCKLQASMEDKGGKLTSELLKTSFSYRPSALALITKIAALLTIIGGVSWMLREKEPILYRGAQMAVVEQSIFADFAYGGKDGVEIHNGSPVRTGIYKLNNGLVKLSYKNGATAIFDAPCHFEIINEKSISLFAGKVSIYSPGATNFQVFASGVKIEDLGTEFAIQLKENKSLDLHVFDGVVKLEAMGEINTQKMHIKEGHAVRVIYDNSGQIISDIDLRSDLFIRQLSSPNEKYAREMVKLNPAVYLPMDIVEGGLLRDYSINKNHGTSNNVRNSKFFTAGKFGPSIQTSGANRQSYIFLKAYPTTPDGTITGMAWVYAKSRPNWGTIMKNWGEADAKGQFHFGLNIRGQLDIEVRPKNMDFYKKMKDKSNIQISGNDSIHLFAREKFPLNSWQHVAFIYDRNTLSLYRNGKLVVSQKLPAMSEKVHMKGMSIGSKLSRDKGKISKYPGHWDGKLDEVALFNRAMSAAEILYIYKSVYAEHMK
ncbi:MAG: LamG domain-containing protein [Lentisphaeraceae bacterium]|nr:LamG domain-containing protein [Lentisphaeraceae bacterium]